MKKLLLIIFLAAFGASYGQTVTGSKTRFPGIWWSSKDTANATSADSIVVLANRGDTSLYYRYSVGSPWRKVATYTGSGFVMVSDTANMLYPYKRYYPRESISAGSGIYYDTATGVITNISQGGAGGGVNYYFNGGDSGSVSTYKLMSKVPNTGASVNFSITGDGVIAQFITNRGDPNSILIPGGVWHFSFDAIVSSSGGSPYIYANIYKYSTGGTATLLATTDSVQLVGGTLKSPYLTDAAMPNSTIDTSDRIMVRFYTYNATSKTVTLYTDDNNLAYVATTFARGISSLNGLTASTQLLSMDTTATGFSIVSSNVTHTFKFPPLLKISDTTGKWIANQYGQTLGQQNGKFWLSDTIKTSGIGSFGIAIKTDSVQSSQLALSGDQVFQRSAGIGWRNNTGNINFLLSKQNVGSTDTLSLGGYSTVVPIATRILSHTPVRFGMTDGSNNIYRQELQYKSGTIALTSDIPVAGTFTNRRIPFVNSSGQLKDTTGFYFDGTGLNIPLDIYSAGNYGYNGGYVFATLGNTGNVGSFQNTNSEGTGVFIQGGTNLNKYSLKVSGYSSADSIANFNPLGAYFYKPINAGSNSLTAGAIGGTSLTASGLTNRRIPFLTTGGQLKDTVGFTWGSAILNIPGSVSAPSGFSAISTGSVYGLIIDRASTSNYGGVSFRTNGSGKWFTGMRELGDDAFRIYSEGSASDVVSFAFSTGAATFSSLGTGTVYSNAGTLTNTNPSDSSLKDSIKTYTYGLNEVLQLKPKSFYYKSDSAKTSLKYGFIAQDVQKIMPDVVRKLNPKDSTSKLGLESDGIYVALVNAIKEQQAQIEELKARLANLEAILQKNGIM